MMVMMIILPSVETSRETQTIEEKRKKNVNAHAQAKVSSITSEHPKISFGDDD